MQNTLLRGVNLGGWLVLEQWITPSLFTGTDAVDEYTFMQTNDAAQRLKQHRDTFITEADFEWLHHNGLNAIRLPIGYWLLEADGPYAEGIAYVDWAFAMAEKYDLQVLLDLHGAPGSQNGHDHSGREGKADWFKNDIAQQQTLRILTRLHARYKDSPSYWGIELLNEPKTGWPNTELRRFYTEAARSLAGTQKIVFHDGFKPRLMNGALHSDQRSVMDIHLYHMASWIARYMSARQFVCIAGWWWGRLLRKLAKKQPVVVGEWSIVLKGKKLRHLPPNESEAYMRQFGSTQLAMYEQCTTGWFYWTYKTEGHDAWNFLYLVETNSLELP